MNHLISSLDLGRIENSLLQRRDELATATSWMFNIVALGLVLLSFTYFLYVQYTTHSQEVDEEKRIPFTPTTWYSATRNLRSEDYGGKPFETETGYGIP